MLFSSNIKQYQINVKVMRMSMRTKDVDSEYDARPQKLPSRPICHKSNLLVTKPSDYAGALFSLNRYSNQLGQLSSVHFVLLCADGTTKTAVL